MCSTMLDKLAYRKDIAQGRKPDISKPGTEYHIDGLHNIIFLVMIVVAVILSGALPGVCRRSRMQPVHVRWNSSLWRICDTDLPGTDRDRAMILLSGAACHSRQRTRVMRTRRNHFTWGAIQEVAILFIGIFITMQPALMHYLRQWDRTLELPSRYEMFWATGCAFQLFWTIHQPIWYSLQQQEHLDSRVGYCYNSWYRAQ